MAIISGVGSSPSVGPTSGGKVYAFNALDAVTPVQVAPANPNRRKITFHNPGSVDVLIFPQYQQTTGSNTPLNVTTSARGGSFLLYANGADRTIEGECQGAWFALAVSATGNPLTVMDSNS